MCTLYTIITGMSIVGNPVIDIFLSILFDIVSFTIAWKIGGLGSNPKSRQVLHWTSRIGMYALLVNITQNIFL